MYEEFKKISGLNAHDEICSTEGCAEENFSNETVRNRINRTEKVISDIISDLKLSIRTLEQENKELRKLVADMTAVVDRRTRSLENLYNTTIEKINDNNLGVVINKENYSIKKLDKYNIEPDPDDDGSISEEYVQDLLTYPKRYFELGDWIFTLNDDHNIYRFMRDGSRYQMLFSGCSEISEIKSRACRGDRDSLRKYFVEVYFKDLNYNDRKFVVPMEVDEQYVRRI